MCVIQCEMFSVICDRFPVQAMAQQAGAGRRYLRAFVSGFFVAVPVTVTVLDRLACVARVEGASMQVSGSHVQQDRRREVNPRQRFLPLK